MQDFMRDFMEMLQIIDLSSFLIPWAGVGGGVDAREYVELVPLIKSTSVFLAGVGILFGLGLALTAKRFAVKIDPRVEKVMDVLAHAH
jgi:uncharacterized membrane protein